MAMKNIQPLDVIPILGSLPVSPTSLNVKLISSGGTSTGIPFESVTKTPSGAGGSSGACSGGSSFPKQPDNADVNIRRTINNDFARMIIAPYASIYHSWV